jgi:hypothetical protein
LWLSPTASTQARALPIGTPSNAFWSYDSKEIAFGAEGKLKAIQIATDTVRTLTEVPGDFISGVWNRDGLIVFGCTSGLYKMPAGGGSPAENTWTKRYSGRQPIWRTNSDSSRIISIDNVVHSGLRGGLPDPEGATTPLNFDSYQWQHNCRGLYQTPIAA